MPESLPGEWSPGFSIVGSKVSAVRATLLIGVLLGCERPV
jgi:hypothetical protein